MGSGATPPGRSTSDRAVAASRTGMDAGAQLCGDRRVDAFDLGQGPADGPADRDPGAFGVAGEGTGSAGEPGVGGQFGEDPVAFGTGPDRAGPVTAGRQVVDLIREVNQALPVL